MQNTILAEELAPECFVSDFHKLSRQGQVPSRLKAGANETSHMNRQLIIVNHIHRRTRSHTRLSPQNTLHDSGSQQTSSLTTTLNKIPVLFKNCRTIWVRIGRIAENGAAVDTFRSLLVMFVFLSLISVAKAAPDRTGVSYSRDYFSTQQTLVREQITEAMRYNESAGRLLDSNLIPEASSSLIRSIHLLDSADVSLESHLDRVAQLKSSPLAYIKADEQRKLKNSYDVLLQQLETALEKAMALRQRCVSTNDQDTAVLVIFLTKREDFRNRARTGSTDPVAVLEECRRLAAVRKTESEFALLKRKVDIEFLQLRQKREQTNVAPAMPIPQIVVVTNIVEKRIPIPTRTVITNKVIEYVTNVQKIFVDRPILPLSNSVSVQIAQTNPPRPVIQTNATTSLASEKGGTNSVAVGIHNERSSPPVEPHIKVPSAPSGISVKLAIGVLGVILIAAIVTAGVATYSRNRLVKIELSEQGTGENHGVIVAGPGEVVILCDPPHSAPSDMCGTSSSIARDWFGRPVLVAVDGITLNGVQLAGHHRLRPGDQITSNGSAPGTGWIFQGMTTVEMHSLEPQSETI